MELIHVGEVFIMELTISIILSLRIHAYELNKSYFGKSSYLIRI